MHLDLSTLSIPPADVVPEPNEHDLTWFNAAFFAAKSGESAVHDYRSFFRCLASLARRCRELEADAKRRDRQLNCGAGEDGICAAPDSGFVVAGVNSCAACAIQRLESELDRLKRLLVWRDDAGRWWNTVITESYFPTEAAAWAAVRKAANDGK